MDGLSVIGGSLITEYLGTEEQWERKEEQWKRKETIEAEWMINIKDYRSHRIYFERRTKEAADP